MLLGVKGICNVKRGMEVFYGMGSFYLWFGLRAYLKQKKNHKKNPPVGEPLALLMPVRLLKMNLHQPSQVGFSANPVLMWEHGTELEIPP